MRERPTVARLDRPDVFERGYFALLAPVKGTRWTRGNLLIVLLVAAQTAHLAYERTPGLLHGVLSSALAGLAVSVAFLWWREAPVVVAVVAVAGLALNGARIPVLLALYAVAKYQQGWRSVAIGLLGLAFVVLSIALPGHLTMPLGREVVFTATLAFFAVLSGLVMAAYERTILALREERARRAEQVKAQERVRLAREMHDILGHRIAIMAMHAGAIEFVRGSGPQSRQLARSIGDTARAAMGDLRQVLSALRTGEDSVIVGRRLSDLDGLVAEARTSGLRINYEPAAAGGDHVPAEVALTAYRAVQEALTNVAKYAPDAETRITITREPTAVVVRVGNSRPADATRAVSAAGSGFGLLGLRERTMLLGGQFEAGPTSGGGWLVHLRVPTGADGAPAAHGADGRRDTATQPTSRSGQLPGQRRNDR
ncbi:sensor histidine kinase [Kitasatospora sp. NPDC008050]|uniref:sensor histidine kinase n=1 Tax=Kitasatospora sp. NPDC008050 TaxID=3364021 RepID=UPI0036E22757